MKMSKRASSGQEATRQRFRAWRLAQGRGRLVPLGLGLLVIFGIASLALARTPKKTYTGNPELKLFIDAMASKHGFDAAALETLFARATHQPRIIKAMSKATKRKPWDDYRPMFVNPARVEGGVRFWNEHSEVLAKARREFGVPEELIISILGIETHYGKNTGSFRVLDALTTLAFDYPPRADFFSSELEQYLLLTREEEVVGAFNARGSYAGAMGIAQFMPGSYRYFAVDFDGDGRRDLFQNVDDAIGSVANYLKRHGWLAGEPLVVRAQVSGEHYEAYVNSSLELVPSSSRYNSFSFERSRFRNASKSSDRHRVTRLTTDFETPVPLSTSANVASMSRVDIPWTYIRAISSSSFSVRLT